MNNCDLRQEGSCYRCQSCGWRYHKLVRHNCSKGIAQKGPGNYLHDALISKFKWTKRKGCGCKKLMQLMNAWGPRGCRENIDKIVGQMVQEAVKREWKMDGRPLLSLAANAGTRLPGGMVFARAWARRLVLKAIRRSEQDESNKMDLRDNDSPETTE